MSENINTVERGLRKTRIGVVVSDKMDKTVVIQIKTRVREPVDISTPGTMFMLGWPCR